MPKEVKVKKLYKAFEVHTQAWHYVHAYSFLQAIGLLRMKVSKSIGKWQFKEGLYERVSDTVWTFYSMPF